MVPAADSAREEAPGGREPTLPLALCCPALALSPRMPQGLPSLGPHWFPAFPEQTHSASCRRTFLPSCLLGLLPHFTQVSAQRSPSPTVPTARPKAVHSVPPTASGSYCVSLLGPVMVWVCVFSYLTSVPPGKMEGQGRSLGSPGTGPCTQQEHNRGQYPVHRAPPVG